MSSELVAKLKKWFEEAKDWDRMVIVRGRRIVVEVVKRPARESKSRVSPATLALHIKKADAFRGMFIDTVDDLEDLVAVLSNEKIKEIAKAIEEINREPKVFI